MCPFAPIFLGNNCFRVKYLESTLSFDIYLGTIWKEATAAKESIEILTGWWNDVLQIFGTSWISCGCVVLVNVIFACYLQPEGGHWQKIVLKSFEEQGLIGLSAKFQLCQSCASCFSPITATFWQKMERNIFYQKLAKFWH